MSLMNLARKVAKLINSTTFPHNLLCRCDCKNCKCSKMTKLYFPVVLACISLAGFVVGSPVVRPLPPTKPTRNYTHEEIHPFPSCSMKITAEQTRSGVIDERYRWRDGFIVHPDRGFTQNEYNVINDGLYDLSQILCIPVLMWPQDSNPTGDYVEIMRGGSGSGCWSYVGRNGGRQDLNLQFDGCIHRYIVIHEAIHALGYYHEQSRPDRDQHVNILWDNIFPEYHYAFDRFDDTTTFNVPYDLGSIMHYDSNAFSHNGQPTVLAKDGSRIPTNTVMTGNDVAKLQRMYNC